MAEEDALPSLIEAGPSREPKVHVVPDFVPRKPAKGRPGHHTKNLPPPTTLFARIPEARPEYFEEGGLRKVRPYTYAFNSWAKERWQGRRLIDIYGEFRDRSTEYYEWAIETGAIVVNNTQSSPDTVVKNGDLLSNVLHRHEPPVVGGPIKILYDGRLPGNDGVTLVVEKPGSMPIHPTGRYNFNTLLEILKYDYDLPLIHTSNRLDRLTSGVMVCSLTVEGSKELGAWFGGRKGGPVEKEYVARAKGKFPEEEVVCEEPLLTIDRQIGINVVHPEGRESKTIFKRMSYDAKSDTSVIHCRPITGRSHQIRVHLQFLGYPIANDPVYQNAAAWGTGGGKGGVFGAEHTVNQVQEKRDELREARTEASREAGDKWMEAIKEKAATPSSDPLLSGRMPHDAPLSPAAALVISTLRNAKDEAEGWARKRDMEAVTIAKQKEGSRSLPGFCETCFTPLISDPKPDQLFIWLHAMRYKTKEWDWGSELPFWAHEDYEVPPLSPEHRASLGDHCN